MTSWPLLIAAILGPLWQLLAASEQAACEGSDRECSAASSRDGESVSLLQTPALKETAGVTKQPHALSIPPHPQLTREQCLAAISELTKMFPEQTDAIIAHMDELIDLVIDGGELPSKDPSDAPPRDRAASVALAQAGHAEHCSCSKTFQYCWKKELEGGDAWCYMSAHSPIWAPMSCAGTCTLDYGEDPEPQPMMRGAANPMTACFGKLMELVSSVVSFVALLGSPADAPVMLLQSKVMKALKSIALDSTWTMFLETLEKERLGDLVDALTSGDMEHATQITKDIYLSFMDLGLLSELMTMGYKEMGWFDWAAGSLVLVVEVGSDFLAPGASDAAAQALQAAHLAKYAYAAFGTCTGLPAPIP